MLIRTLTAADIPLGMRLKSQNGWNQLEADWRRFLAMEPDGCFVAEQDGAGVGTACTCIFGPVAWVAMVLVDAAARQRGIGTALMEHALAFLDSRGVVSVRLDATPLGRPIYEKLGFREEYTLARFEGTLPPASVEASARRRDDGVRPVTAETLADVIALDREITGTDRRKFLERLFDEQPAHMRQVMQDGRLAGYLAARPGSRAWQVGPCLGDAAAGPMLLADAGRRLAGEAVFLDVPLDHRAAVDEAARMGLAVQRHLLRMGRGPRVVEQLDRFWTGSGPEKG